ncbi:MAG: hypothetical protein AAFX09_01845 [Pseudomonadota bacterium]
MSFNIGDLVKVSLSDPQSGQDQQRVGRICDKGLNAYWVQVWLDPSQSGLGSIPFAAREDQLVAYDGPDTAPACPNGN